MTRFVKVLGAAWGLASWSLLGVYGAEAGVTKASPEFEVANGFNVKMVAGEPEIRQPLSLNFDDRGRLWVIQYLQYPTPAGLKPVKVDQYLRTTYDHVPEPPPRGPKGADRITICEDTDGDGRMDVFVHANQLRKSGIEEALAEGDKVRFIIEKGSKGNFATHISRVTENAENQTATA